METFGYGYEKPYQIINFKLVIIKQFDIYDKDYSSGINCKNSID